MLDTEYELVKKVQNHHWWWLGRKAIIENIINKHVDLSGKLAIADVGCGFGANISMLRQYGDVTGLELNKDAINKIREKWGESVNTMVWRSPDTINQKFDLIMLADVLEHIPNDQEAVDWIYEHLNDGGYALLTVPAHQLLWTEMDDVVHHFRRYSKKQLLNLFVKFKVVKFSFYNIVLFPVKLLFVGFVKTIRTLKPKLEKRSYNELPPRIINNIFKYILYFEAKIIKYFSMPLGVSIVILVRK